LPEGGVAVALADGGSQTTSGVYLLYSVSEEEWLAQVVDQDAVPAGRVSVASSTGKIAVCYHDADSRELRLASIEGRKIVLDAVDVGKGVGLHNSIAFSPDGNVAVFYLDWMKTELRFAECLEGRWVVTKIGQTSYLGTTVTLCYDSAGRPWVSYVDSLNRMAYVGFRDRGAWDIEGIRLGENPGPWCSLALAYSSEAWLALCLRPDYNAKKEEIGQVARLVVGSKADGDWRFDELATESDFPVLGVSAVGAPLLIYYDTAISAVKYMVGLRGQSCSDVVAAVSSNAIGEGGLSYPPALAVGNAGTVYIAFVDSGTNQVKLIRRDTYVPE